MSLLSGLGRLSIFLKIPCKNQLFTVEKVFKSRFPVIDFFSVRRCRIHTTPLKKDLMEFFDDQENWSKLEVRVGRSWKVEELRIKSNSDLHKLWYVLLKEKNMLLTMEHEYHRQGKGLPNPERLDKVEESMENLETVVRERNTAYFELETGEIGERPCKIATNCFGLTYKYKMREHLIKKKFNKAFLAEEKLQNYTTDHAYVKDFLRRLDEKRRRIDTYYKKKRYNVACELMKRFPHLDEESLKAQFSDIDIEEVKRDKKSRAHQENLY